MRAGEPAILFEVDTPLKLRVRLTRRIWESVVSKHPDMLGCEAQVRLCLTDPSEVRGSSSDPDALLVYLDVRERRFVCVVAKQDGVADGFVLTAYATDKKKIGRVLWTR